MRVKIEMKKKKQDILSVFGICRKNKGFRQGATVFFILLFFILAGISGYAQQRPTYTQYVDNMQVINPAFAGAQKKGTLLVLARSQWVQIEGAPSTRLMAYNSAVVSKRLGYGVSIISDKIGPLKETGVYFDYSFFLRVSDNYDLGMGVKGGVSFYRANLTDLQTIEGDPIFDNDIYANFLPNFGLGLHLFSKDTYFGLSIPRIIENEITRENVSTNYLDKQEMHFYFMAGHEFKLNENFQLQTHGMLKYVSGAPLSVDATAMVGFKKEFWLGGMCRFGDSFGFIARFKPTDKLSIGYSYDFIISELSEFQNGSHEISLSYDFELFRIGNQRTAY